MKNLKAIRKETGIKQKDIAELLGISKQTFNKWEMGRVPVARKHWKKLAALLKITADELERVLVQTLLDACIATADPRPLANAKTSRQYRQELLADALLRFHAACPSAPVQDETAELRREVQILQLQNRILELEKENAELRREVERLRRPAPSSLSGLTDTPKYNHEPEVKK